MSDINEIIRALGSENFESEMRKLGYNLLMFDSFCKSEYLFESKDSNIIYFDKSDMQYVSYQRCRSGTVQKASKTGGEE